MSIDAIYLVYVPILCSHFSRLCLHDVTATKWILFVVFFLLLGIKIKCFVNCCDLNQIVDSLKPLTFFYLFYSFEKCFFQFCIYLIFLYFFRLIPYYCGCNTKPTQNCNQHRWLWMTMWFDGNSNNETILTQNRRKPSGNATRKQ